MSEVVPLGKGEEILRELVRIEKDGLAGATYRLVERIDWAVDGRSISLPLRRLAGAGLVERTDSIWKPTARGREVDAILDRITARRGGEFAGRYQAGIGHSESFALR